MQTPADLVKLGGLKADMAANKAANFIPAKVVAKAEPAAPVEPEKPAEGELLQAEGDDDNDLPFSGLRKGNAAGRKVAAAAAGAAAPAPAPAPALQGRGKGGRGKGKAKGNGRGKENIGNGNEQKDNEQFLAITKGGKPVLFGLDVVNMITYTLQSCPSERWKWACISDAVQQAIKFSIEGFFMLKADNAGGVPLLLQSIPWGPGARMNLANLF